MKIVTVSNAKGGCGKTAVASNLAIMAGEAGYHTLFLDRQAHATYAIGYERSAGFFLWFTGNASLAMYTRGIREHVSVLPGNEMTAAAEASSVGMSWPATRLENKLKPAMQTFDLVVCDTSGHGPLNEMALVASNLIVAPMPVRGVDLDGLGLFSGLIDAIFAKVDRSSPHVVVVPNRYDQRTNESARVFNLLKSSLWDTEGWTLADSIPECVEISRAADAGLALAEHDSRAGAVPSLQALLDRALCLVDLKKEEQGIARAA